MRANPGLGGCCGTGAPLTRASCRTKLVLAAFVRERMITLDADAARITHDALLTVWPRQVAEVRQAGPASARTASCADLGQSLTAAEWSGYAPGVPYRAPCS